MELYYMFWIGVILLFFGTISIIQLGRIIYKYYDMYPWFGGLQPWEIGYYLFPIGCSLLIVRELLIKGIISYRSTILGSLAILTIFIIPFLIFAILYPKYKQFLVLVGRNSLQTTEDNESETKEDEKEPESDKESDVSHLKFSITEDTKES